MYRILIADDEERIRSLIKKYAEFEGHQTAEAANGMEAVEMARAGLCDIIIMDVMMPELDGFSAVEEIRKNSPVPIIMLSARGEEYDRIHGFRSGADDYVVKPFSPKELMLRIEAVIKRGGKNSAGETAHDVFEFRGLKADFTARLVYVDGRRLELSPKEYELLSFLIKNRGIALTRERLITEVWGYDFYGDDRTLDTHIKLLRRSLGTYGACIVTLRGTGYRFDCVENRLEKL
ncbi:MAG: response regulator transcription factor [Oscillospiraceae bacterium]|nr:response regulator transcription factor [Oscillospiraceae bacterium]